MTARRPLAWAAALPLPVIGISLWFMIGEMEKMTALCYEAGAQVGVEVCTHPIACGEGGVLQFAVNRSG